MTLQTLEGHSDIRGSPQNMLVATKSGLYRLIFTSILDANNYKKYNN